MKTSERENLIQTDEISKLTKELNQSIEVSNELNGNFDLVTDEFKKLRSLASETESQRDFLARLVCDFETKNISLASDLDILRNELSKKTCDLEMLTVNLSEKTASTAAMISKLKEVENENHQRLLERLQSEEKP